MNAETTPALGNSAETTAAPLLSFFDEVENIRSEIESVAEELAWTENAALPKDEAKKRVSAAVAAAIDQYHPPVWHFNEPVLDSNVLQEMLTAHGNPTGGDDATVRVDLTPLLAVLFGDELTTKIHRLIDRLDYTAGPPSKDRPTKIRALKATLADLGKKEESLICGAEERGLFIPRREDADPAIVLEYQA